MKPLVVIDARMVISIPHGIARYVTQLAKGLAELQKTTELSYRPLFLTHTKKADPFFCGFQSIQVSSPFLSPQEWIEVPKVLKALRAKIYHSPSFSSLWKCPCTSIVTIHDLNHLVYGNCSKKLYYYTLLRRFAQHSQAIVTVSEFSQQKISEWLRIPKNSIDIAYNALEPPDLNLLGKITRPVQNTQFNLEQGHYFFCLSNSKPHKNLLLLIQAYEIYKAQCPDPWPLVLTIQAKVPTGVKAIGEQPESEISFLLSSAAGGFFPSLYEGFGLPPIEAALAGIPIAVSSIQPHQEGLKDLRPEEVLWVDPKNVQEWVNAFHKIRKGEVSQPSENSRKALLQRFNSLRLGQTMDRIYRRVLEAKE